MTDIYRAAIFSIPHWHPAIKCKEDQLGKQKSRIWGDGKGGDRVTGTRAVNLERTG